MDSTSGGTNSKFVLCFDRRKVSVNNCQTTLRVLLKQNTICHDWSKNLDKQRPRLNNNTVFVFNKFDTFHFCTGGFVYIFIPNFEYYLTI